MPRGLTSGMKTAVAADQAEYCHLLELHFSGGTLRCTDAAQPILWNTFTWTALGGLINVGAPSESADLSAGDTTVAFSGVSLSDVVSFILNENYVGQSVIIYRAHFSGGSVVVDPIPLFSGFMNGGWTITEDRPATNDTSRGTCTVTGQFTSRLAKLDQRRGIQANVGSHQLLYPNDQFFRYAGSNIGQKLVWKIA